MNILAKGEGKEETNHLAPYTNPCGKSCIKVICVTCVYAHIFVADDHFEPLVRKEMSRCATPTVLVESANSAVPCDMMDKITIACFSDAARSKEFQQQRHY